MSEGKNPTVKRCWFAPVDEPALPFGYKPGAGFVHDESTGRFVRFVFAAHAIGADAEAIATFLNGLNRPKAPSQRESEDF